MKWLEDEAQLSRQRRASAVGGAQGNGGRGCNRRSRRESDQGNRGRGVTAGVEGVSRLDESRKETTDRVARQHQADQLVEYVYDTRTAKLLHLVRTGYISFFPFLLAL